MASPLNARTVEEILRNSLPNDIEALLARVGYRPQARAQIPRPDYSAAIANSAAQYLLTSAGRTAVEKARADAVAKEAEAFLSSEPGARALADVKARLFAAEVEQDDDLVNRLCREAAERVVGQWLRSPRGRDAMAHHVRRALEESIATAEPAKRRSWLDQVAGEVMRDIDTR